ncbi:MAG: transglutaminase-like domain-containing protein [Proteobacteria bacterium]|nr:transglutaminase-like domain-containing protein [Pseudomonadota bacterium]
MKRWLIILSVVLIAVPVFGENLLLDGGQESQIKYQLVQKVQPSKGVQELELSYVIPETFISPTYSQKVSDIDFNFFPPPSDRKDRTDKRGNKVIEVTWKAPSGPVTTTIRLTATNRTQLQDLRTSAPFPLASLPEPVKGYLETTEQVAADDSRIQLKARELTDSAQNEFDAVQKILTWVVDHMHYVLSPESYDAIYSFQSGKGNCQNYSHLSAALMRAVGIPVRIVNGVTLKQPYDIGLKDAILTMKMAQGRHSWIEVYFPDLGWIPFDPQGTELFVSNRFIRVETGLDNNETRQDGLMRWVQARSASGRPTFEERIDAEFVEDRVELNAQKTDYGPRGLLLCPQVKAAFSKATLAPTPPAPAKIPENILKSLQFTEPYLFGNLDFPENVDFLAARGPARQSAEGTMEMRKNFLVETAEYVTTQGNQYAQTFILTKPMQLQLVGLALHKFNDEGQLWLELLKDKEGIPGDIVATSDLIDLARIKFVPGYAWVDFDFSGASVVLSPGRYWVALGFTGSPIVNWFFTYGKPVGPQDGTRYKIMFDETWSRSLAFEFNYRVTGLAVK